MEFNQNNLYELIKICHESPLEIGFTILKMFGYKIEEYSLSGAWYVINKEGKIVAYDSGAYVD